MGQYSKLLQKLTVLELSGPGLEELRTLISAVGDWQAFLREAEVHGLSGLVLKHAEKNVLGIPQPIILNLKALHLRHKAISDVRYEEAVHLFQHLKEAGVPPLILKGFVLSPLIYPYDGLRPMRDIDLLVSRSKETLAANILRDCGYKLADEHENKYQRDSNQMPNATKTVRGFKISIEIHHDAIGRDSRGHLYYEDVRDRQTVQWRDLELETLGHELMLHQICRHLEGRHPGAVLKLINVMDIVLYSEHFLQEINWQQIRGHYGHVINTLKCLHLLVPLSQALQQKIGGVEEVEIKGLGEIMPHMRAIFGSDHSLFNKLRSLFLPSDWWLHLYYGVPPERSLIPVKILRHPARLAVSAVRRVLYRFLGG
jgi:hypothetical protein